MLKEQVNEWVSAAWKQGHGFDEDNHEPEHEIKVVAGYTQEILNLFKAEVDKLTVIDDARDFVQEDYKAQLQDTKKQLLEGLEG